MSEQIIESPYDEPHEFLVNFVALVRWGLHCALLDEVTVERLLEAGERHPAAAAATFGDAIALRAALQRAFAAIVTGARPPPDDLAVIHERYVAGLSRARLVERNGRFVWASVADPVERFLLWPIVQSAVDLLINGDLTRVKQCSCGWLFYDGSKNGSRRWCSMEGCGTQAKMRRYNARRRLARSAGGQ